MFSNFVQKLFIPHFNWRSYLERSRYRNMYSHRTTGYHGNPISDGMVQDIAGLFLKVAPSEVRYFRDGMCETGVALTLRPPKSGL